MSKIQTKILPSKYQFAQNPIALAATSTEYEPDGKFQYYVDILFNKQSIIDFSIGSLNGINKMKIECTNPTVFKGVNKVFIESPDYYVQGIYNILRVTDDGFFIEGDLTTTSPNINNINIYNIIHLKIAPDIDENALNCNIQNIIKDYCSTKFKDGWNIYGNDSSMFKYTLSFGCEYIYKWYFTNNLFDNGYVSFIKEGSFQSELNNILFNSGDEIEIVQDYSTLSYQYLYKVLGRLILATDNQAIADKFADIQDVAPITITNTDTSNGINGETYAFLGGVNVVNSITNAIDALYSLTPGTIKGYLHTELPYTNTVNSLTSLVQNGQIRLKYVPGYDGVTTDLFKFYYNVGGAHGASIRINKSYTQSTPPVGGYITFRNHIPTPFYMDVQPQNYYKAYDTKIAHDSNNLSFMTNYVDNTNNLFGFQISSIMRSDKEYRLDKNSKGYIAIRSDKSNGGNSRGYVQVRLYYNGLVATYLLADLSVPDENKLIPFGLTQLLTCYDTGFLTGSVNPHTIDINDIDKWDMGVLNDAATSVISNILTFKLIDVCGRKENNYSLIWKDKLGSWLNLPTKMIMKKTINQSKESYYTDENTFKIDGQNSEYEHPKTNRGHINYYSKEIDQYTLNTEWLFDYENELVEDLLTSTSIYLENNETGVVIPVHKINEKLDIKNTTNNNVFQYKFEVTDAKNKIRY